LGFEDRRATGGGATGTADPKKSTRQQPRHQLEREASPVQHSVRPGQRFLTVGFLPPLFRAQMEVNWTRRDEQVFAVLIRLVAVVNGFLPGPLLRFPFNVCLQDLRIRRLVKAAR
jgi:uncharacterized protein (DUF2236 family)